MKFRLRSQATKQTHRLEIPDASTLADLKTLIASQLRLSVPPQSIRLSLNTTDELVAATPSDPLPSLGLATGDILYFYIPSDDHQTLAPAPIPKASAEKSDLATSETLDSDTAPTEEEIYMDVDDVGDDANGETLLVGRAAPSIPCLLKRVIEDEKGEAESVLGRLVIFVHASLLESGFVVVGSGCKLPHDWASKATSLSVQYTIPDLVGGGGDGEGDGRDVRSVKLRLSVIGTHATVYGCLEGSRDVYRVSVNLAQLAGLLSSDMSALSEGGVKEIFELWKLVKDGLSLPLLIDFCDASGIPLPSCFMSLPTELKIKIVGCLPGVDVARIECTCTELRFLSSNEDIWKRKFAEEFGLMVERANPRISWKERYACCLSERKMAEEVSKRRVICFPYNRIPRVYGGGLPRFPIIGGYYDIYPDFNGQFPAQPRIGYPVGFPPLPLLPTRRRNLSPNLDLSRQL